MSLALLILASTSSAAVSAAAPPASVRLHLADCITQGDLVHDLVSIELGAARVVEHPADLEVRTSCEDGRLRIFIERRRAFAGASSGVVDIAERRITLADVQADGGGRLVALNIAELVQDLPAPPRAPARRAPRTVEVAPATVAIAADAPGPYLWVGAAPTVRYVSGPGRALAGGRLTLGVGGGPDAALPWSVSLDGGFEGIDGAVAAGRLQTQVAGFALRAGVDWGVTDQLALLTHLGVRGGIVWLTGESDDEAVQTTTGRGPWFGPLVSLGVRYGGAVGVRVEVEGGWTVYGVFGDAAGARVGLEDGWLGAALAVDWRFGG